MVTIERREDGRKHINEAITRALEPLHAEAARLAREAVLVDRPPTRDEVPDLLRQIADRARAAAGRIRGLIPEAEQAAVAASLEARAELDIPDRDVRSSVSMAVSMKPYALARVLDDRAREIESLAVTLRTAAGDVDRALQAAAAARAVVVDRDRDLAGVVHRALERLELGAAA